MSNMTHADELVQKIALIKTVADALAAQKSTYEQELIKTLAEAGMKSITVEAPNGVELKASVVAATRVVLDEDGLHSALGDAVWDTLQKQVFDKDKLEASIVMGAIDKTVVAANSELKENKPFVKITGTYAPAETLDLNTETGIVAAQKTALGTQSLTNEKGNLKPAARRAAVKRPKK